MQGQDNKLEVAEMRMLRWMCGVTKLDKIRNERIRGKTKGGITKNLWLLHDFNSMATGFSWIHCEEVTCSRSAMPFVMRNV